MRERRRPVSQLSSSSRPRSTSTSPACSRPSPSRDVERALRRRLFDDAAYEPDLDAEERDRYRVANDNANRYAASLEAQFVAPRRIPEMLGELRRFYRCGLAAKLATIARAA